MEVFQGGAQEDAGVENVRRCCFHGYFRWCLFCDGCKGTLKEP